MFKLALFCYNKIFFSQRYSPLSSRWQQVFLLYWEMMLIVRDDLVTSQKKNQFLKKWEKELNTWKKRIIRS